jgi:hypothetical protein
MGSKIKHLLLAAAMPTVAPTPVTADNFVRAETDRMFGDFLTLSGGVNYDSRRRTGYKLPPTTPVRR